MANRRMIAKCISLSEQVNDLSDGAALLFTWMIPHADDWGRMRGKATIVRATVIPLRSDISSELVESHLCEMVNARLIVRYDVDGDSFIQFPKWEKYQTNLHHRTASSLPEPQEQIYKLHGDSGKFREMPTQFNIIQSNVKEGKGNGANAPAVPTPLTTKALLEAFPSGCRLPTEKAFIAKAIELGDDMVAGCIMKFINEERFGDINAAYIAGAVRDMLSKGNESELLEYADSLIPDPRSIPRSTPDPRLKLDRAFDLSRQYIREGMERKAAEDRAQTEIFGHVLSAEERATM